MKIPFLDRRPQVSVVRLAGLIGSGGGRGFGAPGLSAEAVGPVLERAFALPRLRAVVLQIDSPGGSPVQSSLIAGRIRRLAAEKGVPVLACVEDAAASGGYWLACAADEIVCDPASILGSIGVVSAGFGFEGAIARLGIERRLRTAGEDKAFADPFRPLPPEQGERLDALLAELHAEFRDWVRQRRGARLREDEEPLFTGRFWAGRRAVRLGLADRLGDLHGEVERRFGKEVRLRRFGARRPRWPWRLLSGAAAAGTEAALAAVEERAARARLGG